MVDFPVPLQIVLTKLKHTVEVSGVFTSQVTSGRGVAVGQDHISGRVKNSSITKNHGEIGGPQKMAKFLPILGPLRGSIAANTFSRNKGGQYLKQKASPTNMNSTRQQAMRAALADLSADWADLTDPQRSGWNGWADSHPRTDSLGQEYTLTGHQAFVGLNARVFDAGDTPQDDCPDQTSPDALVGGAIAYTDADTISVTFTTTLGATERLMVWQCLPQSGQGNPNLAQARLVGYSAAQAASPVAMDLPWAVTIGCTVNFWLCIQDEHGQISVPVKVREKRSA